MMLSELQKSCENISAGRTATTYMIIGNGLQTVHASLRVIHTIFNKMKYMDP